MKNIRLVALDIDGTLLDDSKEIPPENIAALAEVKAAGIAVAIASGRMLPTIEPLEERLGIDCVLIAYNGAKVVGTRREGRPLIEHRPLAAGVAEECLDFARGAGLVLNFYHEDRLYAEPAGEAGQRLMDLYHQRTGAVYHLTDLDRLRGTAPTKLILLAEPEERERLHSRFSRELEGRAAVTRSEPEYLEIMAPGISKGAALPAIARHLGIATEQILAVGDADNDNEMLEAAGIGVAVANAREETRRIADFVTESSNNDGAVAEAIRRFALGGNTS